MSEVSRTAWVQDRISELTRAYRLGMRFRGMVMEPQVIIKTPSRLHFAKGTVVQRGAILHCGGRTWSNGKGHITIGNGVVVGPYCILYGAGGITLGDYVHLGPGVQLMSQAGEHGPSRLSTRPDYRLAPISIGNGGWIGAGAVILGGATLGECVTVAPNSVVSGAVPDFAVVVGNPGRVALINHQI